MAARKVLLIEDNPDDAFLTEQTLKNYGVADEIVVVVDGIEALEYLFGQKQPEPNLLPSFVLLDLKRSRLNGLAVLRRIRTEKSTRQLPVIIVTGSQDERNIAECYDNGASTYIRTPIDSRKLMVAIDDLHLAPPPSEPSPMLRG